MQSLDYVLAQSIGRGSFGSVYYAINIQSGEEVAIKVLNKKALEKEVFFNGSSDEAAETGVSQVYDEINFMRNFVHPFLMRFIDSLDQDDKIYIVTELAEGIVCSIHERDIPEDTNLPDCILNLYELHNSVYQTSTILPLALHIAAALTYMHKRQHVHGDIKPANILRTADGRYIIGDFGIAKSFEKGLKYREIISPAFAAPDSKGLTPGNDVWAYGVCLYMLLYGEHPATAAGQIYTQGDKVSHWGEVLIGNKREWKRILEARKVAAVEHLTAENKEIGEFYQVKLNHDIIATTYAVISEIVYHCLMPSEERVSMEAVYARLLDFYCKVQATKYARLFDKGFGEELLEIASKLQVDNNQHMAFLVALGHIKNDNSLTQLFQDIMSIKTTDISLIPFEKVEQCLNIKKKSKLIEKLLTAGETDSGKFKRIPGTPPILGKIKDGEETPSSGFSIGNKFKKTLPSNSLASKLVNLPPPPSDLIDEDSDEPQIGGIKPEFHPSFKKSTPSASLASQLAHLPPPQMNSSNDDEPNFGHVKPETSGLSKDSSIVEASLKMPNALPFKKVLPAESLASRIANMPPPEAVNRNQGISQVSRSDMSVEDSESSVKLACNSSSDGSAHFEMSKTVTLRDNGVVNRSSSDSGITDISKESPMLGPNMGSLASNGFEKSNSDESSSFGIPLADKPADLQQSDSATASLEIPQSIYGRFKKPVSMAASMAAKLASLPPPEPDEPSDDDQGFMFIRAAKAKPKDTIKYDIDLREKRDEVKDEADEYASIKHQSFTEILSKYLADDDVFALKEKSEDDTRETLNNEQNEEDGEIEANERQGGFKTDLRERTHFFLSTAEIVSLTMSAPGELPNNKEVKSLFKQISYANDEFKHQQQPFKYDHENDQAKILGLGSFACETLSTGKRSDGTNDFSDSDDDLVEFDAEGDDDFNNTFNEVFNIEEDEEDKSKELSAATAASLVNRGKGKFKTVKESEEEETFEQFAINNVNIVEDDEVSDELTQRKTAMPFSFANLRSSKSSESDSGEFEMHMRNSSTDDEDLPSRRQAVPLLGESLGFALNMNALHDLEDTESKIKLFDEEDDDEIPHNGMQSARILNSGRGDEFMYSGQSNVEHTPKKSEIKEQTDEPPEFLVSARAEQAEAMVLSPKETIIFFHSLVNGYRQINSMLEKEDHPILKNEDYIFKKMQLDEIIDAVIYDKPSVLIITVEIFMTRFEQWKQLLQQLTVNANDEKQIEHALIVFHTICSQFEEYEQFVDKSPAFLTSRSSWVLYSEISFYLQLQERFKLMADNVSSSEPGIRVTINEEEYIKSSGCQEFHDIEIYLGLDFAECTPIVGLRHKVERSTIAIEQSYNCGKMLENEEFLTSLAEKATIITNKNASMSSLENCFFRFKFMQIKLENQLAEYQFAKSHLIRYSFAMASRQVIMPFAIIDSFLDLLMNSKSNAEASTIRASLFNADGAFYMIVSDCGKGMTQEQAEALFKASGPGIGAGMARLRLIVGLYGGIINVSSEEGCGCRIIVKIPMEDEDPKSK